LKINYLKGAMISTIILNSFCKWTFWIQKESNHCNWKMDKI